MLGDLCFVLGAWCAANNNDQQYLQIDLGGMRKVTQIASQGRPASYDYVSSYKISYSQVENSFEFHRMVIILFISTYVRIQNAEFSFLFKKLSISFSRWINYNTIIQDKINEQDPSTAKCEHSGKSLSQIPVILGPVYIRFPLPVNKWVCILIIILITTDVSY